MAREGGWFQLGFRLEEGAGLEPARLGASGAIRAVRPSWSFFGLVAAGAPPVLQGALRAALPSDCRDLLPSETHVLLLREAALEARRVEAGPALDGAPAWRRELRPEEAAAAELPLVPGGYVVPRPDFFRPLAPSLRARKLALGHEHVLLLCAGGALFAWGGGRHGQLGHGELEGVSEPQLVEALHGVPMGEVAAGGWHSASVSDTGDLYMWGWNEWGQLALPSKTMAESHGATAVNAESSTPASGSSAQQESPKAAFISIQAFPALLDMPQGADVSKVSCGSRHTAAVTQTGDLYTWGWGKYGQLGHGDTASSDQPKKVCCFGDWGLVVVDVVCGPWTTFTHALPGKVGKTCS
ncbi:RCC1 domain-containing protein 1 isoform X2 [Eublepharis macularius]|uniref:RCC1 domain-containing protein 1 isoform X2 n=1 Tax=Eublepharis macularius TaxID=481883 RepID=A0AA97KKR2_EUBMA|nr:RCC1 domain-containing protein 1 isoform X2 [Eublepharis macularius]